MLTVSSRTSLIQHTTDCGGAVSGISRNNRRRLLPSKTSVSNRENRKTLAITVQSLHQCRESTQRPRGVSQGTGEHSYGWSLFCNIRDKLAGAQRECRALPYRAFQPS